MRRPSTRDTVDLPEWVLQPLARHYLSDEQIAVDGLWPMFASILFHMAVDAWLRIEGLRGDWNSLDLPVFYPVNGEPTNSGPRREILAQVFADVFADSFMASWCDLFGVGREVAS